MPGITLTLEQRRQAALLYYFTSAEFLELIVKRVQSLVSFTDTTLDYAERVERDRAMREIGWSASHTAANWATHGHPMLATLLQHLYRSRANRASESYEIAGVRSTLTGLSNFSMNWTLPEEEDKFYELSREASDPAHYLDTTIERGWNGLSLAIAWEEIHAALTPLPAFKIRMDVAGETGRKPIRTGVYVPQDDPFGAAQFAWTGGSNGALRPCITLTDLAREYASHIGGIDVWRRPDDAQIEGKSPTDSYFDDWCRRIKRIQIDQDLIESENPRAFCERPCKWLYVERVEGEYEGATAEPVEHQLRAEPGSKVPRSGWWYTPAIKGEPGFRYFDEGSRFPEATSTEWGQVIWQFDPKRQPK